MIVSFGLILYVVPPFFVNIYITFIIGKKVFRPIIPRKVDPKVFKILPICSILITYILRVS